MAKGAHDLWAATAVYLTLLILGMGFMIISYRSEPSGAVQTPLIWPVLMIFIVMGLSFWHSVNPGESFLGWMDWGAFLLMFVLSANFFRSEEDVDLLVFCLVPLFWIESGFILLEVIRLISIRYYTEPIGTMINSNSATAFHLFWVPVFVNRSLRDWKKPGRQKWYWLSGLVAISFNLLLFASTWSFVCLLVGGAVFLGSSRIKDLIKAHRVISWALFVVLGGLTLALICLKLALIYGWFGVHSYRVTTSRFEWWQAGFQMWKDHPWLGVGIGNFPSAYLSYKSGAGQNSLYAHSSVVQLLSETGLFGLAAVVFFLISGLKAGFQSTIKWHRPFLTGLVMVLLFSTLHVTFEHLINLLMAGLFFGILLGPPQGFSVERIRFSILIILVGLSIAAIPYLVSPFLASRFVVDGQSYLLQKDWVKAKNSFEQARSIDKRSWEPYAGLARVAFETGDYQRAVEFERLALERNQLFVPLQKQLEEYQRFLR